MPSSRHSTGVRTKAKKTFHLGIAVRRHFRSPMGTEVANGHRHSFPGGFNQFFLFGLAAMCNAWRPRNRALANSPHSTSQWRHEERFQRTHTNMAYIRGRIATTYLILIAEQRSRGAEVRHENDSLLIGDFNEHGELPVQWLGYIIKVGNGFFRCVRWDVDAMNPTINSAHERPKLWFPFLAYLLPVASLHGGTTNRWPLVTRSWMVGIG